MKCPRCASKLREVQPNAVWLRHWICDECWSCWHLEWYSYRPEGKRYTRSDTRLVLGRNVRLPDLTAPAEPVLAASPVFQDRV